MLLSLIAAFTLGSTGESGRSFLADLRQADSGSITGAFIGGIVFNAANILLVAAISIAGMAVAFPIGIGLALILGVLVNYQASQKGDLIFLMTGVLLVAIAIILPLLFEPAALNNRKMEGWLGERFENPQTGCVSYYTPLQGKKPYSCNITCCMSSVPRGIAMIPLFANGKLNGIPAFNFYQPGEFKAGVKINRIKPGWYLSAQAPIFCSRAVLISPLTRQQKQNSASCYRSLTGQKILR